jgi:hypothetical protein
MKYEGRIVMLAIMAGLPGSLVALIFAVAARSHPAGARRSGR